MNLKTLVSAMLVVVATPCVYAASATNPSPANFATADTHTTTMKDFLARKSQATTAYASGGMFFAYSSTGSGSKPPADYRAAFGEDYKVNGIVKLSWKGTSGESTVIITRLSDGNARTNITTGTSVDFLAPEIGRNYKWTVTNGGTVSGPWYFYTDGEAPRIIPQELAKVGNCRDMGGWVTEDGKYRVRQGLGYRNDHNADFYQYADLKPFWTDLAKVRTDMDLRDKVGSTQWYCNYELDSNANHPGRSPYGEHWWDVLYWNVVREGEYGAKMNDYASLVDNIGASKASTDSKKASVNTWKLFADAQNLPIVVHCSQGRDRTGTVAFVLLGALGVGLDDLYADWALTDYSAPSDFPKATSNEGGSTIVALYNALVDKYEDTNYPTLQSKCEKLLKDMGVTDAQIANLKSYFLEPVEQKLTAAPGGTSVAVPTLSKSRVSKTGSAQKPTVAANSAYTVDYGGGDYTNYGKYLVTVTLKDPTTTHWSDGTIGPKVLPFIIEHVTNVMIGDAVMSFIKGDTSPHIRIGRPRYLGEVSCSYTEEQLNGLPPGDYEATFTAKTCEMASKVNTTTCKFKVYPATEKATYTYEYADLKSAFFKTDYAPAIQSDKVEVRMMDQTAGEGYAPFSCGPYPASMTIMKMSGGFLRYANGGQRVDTSTNDVKWAINTIYKLTANGKSITHYVESTAKSVTKSFSAFDEVNPTPGTAYIGCAIEKTANMGAEGTPGYCQPHRIYHVKAWANGSSLIHEFVPCKTTSGYAMLYDKVTKKIYPFSHTCDKTGSVTLGGAATKIGGGDDPDPGPTPDTKPVTYTWKGGTAQWSAAASWTPGTGATYGYPDHATYATADFPAGVTAATTCTLASDASVLKALFDSPNLTLVLDDAALTVASAALDTTTWGAYNFGNTKTGNPMIEFKGAKAAMITTHDIVRANFGYQGGDTASGTCTLRFTVPATGWETTAPIRTTGDDSTVVFAKNSKLVVNATALGVPSAGATKTVKLATATGSMYLNGTATVTCASGASGEVVVEGNDLVLKVTAGGAPQPDPEPTYHEWIQTDDQGFFKTTFVPNLKTTKFEVKVMATDAAWTTVLAANGRTATGSMETPYGNLIFLGFNDNGTVDWNNTYGGVNCGKTVAGGAFNAVHTLTACGNSITVDGVTSTGSSTAQNQSADGPLFIGAPYDTTSGSMHPLKIYYVKVWDGDALIHNYVPGVTAAGAAILYDTVEKKELTPTKGGAFYCGDDQPAPTPEPEPTPTSAFDAAHTIVCYGDSLTWGTAAAEITMDNRANYHDGRLAGVSGVPESYTYWLSGMILDYNVINQSRAGSPASHMTAWSGESEVVVDRSFTLPATGSVSIPTNLVFTSDCPWGKWGRWAAYPSKWDDPVETFEHWAGFVTPIFPLYERYDGEKTRFSVTGTLCGRHVRVQGIYPNVTTVTVFGTGTAQTVPVGAKFVPDNATLPLYTQGIRILCGSGNDGYRGYNSSVVTDKSGKTIDGGFAKYAKPYFDAFAAKGGKFLIVSQCCQTEDPKLGETQYQSTPTDMETKMAAAYGAHYLNLRMAFMTNGVATAKALGVWPEGSSKPWYDPSTLFHDGTHFTSAGYKVMAEFIRRKLVEIGYVEGDRPAPVDPTAYGAKDTAASEYTWKGYSGPWAYTTNWTPSASATYGIPNHTTYATATFPETIANAFTCTVDAKTDVSKLSFKSPNGTLKIANAALTASAAVGGASVASLEFGDSATGDSVLEFSGANALLKATIGGYRLNIGYTGSESVSGSCTVRYVVPSANWTAAPLQAVGGYGEDGSKVCFWKKARAVVDATALGVPAEGQTLVVPLVSCTASVSFYGGVPFEQFAAASEVVCAKGATGTLVRNGNRLEARIVRGETPGEPEPEPTPDAFDIDHTIVCYGDSITAGWGSEVRAADDRVNYFGGRLAGQTKGSGAGMGYPYMLAGLITNSYNVIEQAKGSMWSDTITAWMGGIDIEVRCDVTLPANGAKTWCPSNLVFGAENPYGREGGLHKDHLIYSDYYNFWAGVQTTDLPVVGDYPEPAGRWSSFSGWIGDVHVRVTGVETGTVPERTGGYYATDHHWSRIGSAEAVTIPAGAKFVPDAVNVYQDAIAVVFAGTNDQDGNPNKATNVIANVARAVAKIPRGRYVVVSPFAPKVRTDAVDQLYKNQFGEHLVPLYDLMESQGLARAVKLGVMTQAEADRAGHWNTVAGLMNDANPGEQDLHPNARGAMVIASFIKDRLIALGYIPDDGPQIDPTEYGPADKTAATYTWKGNSGPWAYTTNWTPSTSATYGIPNQATYATALFPESLAEPFVCTVDAKTDVNVLTFQSPNGTLKLANAALTASGSSPVGEYSSISFGDSPTGDSVLELTGANAMLKAKSALRFNIGSTAKAAASGTCTVRYVVPAGNWSAAPLQAIGGYTTDGAKVYFGTNARVEVDATALGVPAEGQTKIVPLALGTEGVGFYGGQTLDEFAAASKIVCAKGAKGTLVLNGNRLDMHIVAASGYPSWIDEASDIDTRKYDAWRDSHRVNDPEAEQGKEAFLLNCDDTPEAVAEAKKEFVIESIAFNADGTVTVTVSSETQKGYNGRVVIRGAAEVDGDYVLPTTDESARFFKAVLVHEGK